MTASLERRAVSIEYLRRVHKEATISYLDRARERLKRKQIKDKMIAEFTACVDKSLPTLADRFTGQVQASDLLLVDQQYSEPVSLHIGFEEGVVATMRLKFQREVSLYHSERVTDRSIVFEGDDGEDHVVFNIRRFEYTDPTKNWVEITDHIDDNPDDGDFREALGLVRSLSDFKPKSGVD